MTSRLFGLRAAPWCAGMVLAWLAQLGGAIEAVGIAERSAESFAGRLVRRASEEDVEHGGSEEEASSSVLASTSGGGILHKLKFDATYYPDCAQGEVGENVKKIIKPAAMQGKSTDLAMLKEYTKTFTDIARLKPEEYRCFLELKVAKEDAAFAGKLNNPPNVEGGVMKKKVAECIDPAVWRTTFLKALADLNDDITNKVKRIGVNKKPFWDDMPEEKKCIEALCLQASYCRAEWEPC